uniref:Uncharacterized protein n=1 Tax=Cacopsylla melanoneura TaxID=428564 RepID=A0A8D8UBA2_9HEMI
MEKVSLRIREGKTSLCRISRKVQVFFQRACSEFAESELGCSPVRSGASKSFPTISNTIHTCSNIGANMREDSDSRNKQEMRQRPNPVVTEKKLLAERELSARRKSRVSFSSPCTHRETFRRKKYVSDFGLIIFFPFSNFSI